VPILPLDHPEPLAATLGVMLYPGEDEADRKRARAYAAQFLAEPLRRLHEAGGSLSYEELARIHADTGVPLDDLKDRWRNGTATGERFKALFALAHTDPDLASWGNATKLVEANAAIHQVSGSRSLLYEARRRYDSVAHLWAAWCIRDRQFRSDPDVGYEGWHDFQFFLAEAEVLRRWGRTWQPDRAKSEPPLPVEGWHVPDGWEPPQRQRDWPRTGGIPGLTVTAELLVHLRKAGRPLGSG
jgi:hypothetical protein